MNRILVYISFACLLLAAACSPKPTMEQKALQRLPKALEKAMEEEMSLSGGARIVSPETIYTCDSLCLIQCEAVARDSLGGEFRFPVRYVLVYDVFMSAVKGYPVYAETIAGSPTMDREEVEMLKRHCAENGQRIYAYYAGVADPIEKEDL